MFCKKYLDVLLPFSLLTLLTACSSNKITPIVCGDSSSRVEDDTVLIQGDSVQFVVDGNRLDVEHATIYQRRKVTRGIETVPIKVLTPEGLFNRATQRKKSATSSNPSDCKTGKLSLEKYHQASITGDLNLLYEKKESGISWIAISGQKVEEE